VTDPVAALEAFVSIPLPLCERWLFVFDPVSVGTGVDTNETSKRSD